MKQVNILFLSLLFLGFCGSLSAKRLAVSIELGETVPGSIDGSYDNGNILIDSRNLTTTPVHNQCFTTTGIAQDLYGYLFSGNPQHNQNAYSYIRIQNLNTSEEIVEIQLIGVSSHNSSSTSLPMDGSSILGATNDSDYESFDMGSSLDNLSFSPVAGDNAFCPSAKSSDLVSMWEDWFGFDYASEPIKTLRLRFSDGISGDLNFSNPDQKRPIIQAIYIYTDGDGTNTGIGELEGNSSFKVYVSNGELRMNDRASRVCLYNVSGNCVKEARDVQTLSLGELPSGMYIVKAVNQTGGTAVAKIMK